MIAIAVAGLLTVLALAIVLLCGYWDNILIYRTMAREHYPVIWKDLAWGRIHKGDQLDSLLQKHPPLWREDFGPYAHLSYTTLGSLNMLEIFAKDGRLIVARAGSPSWTYVFFDAPAEEGAFESAYSAYLQQERQAFEIHRAIVGGQDVFFAWVIDCHEVADDSYDSEMMAKLAAIYGREYLEASGMLTRCDHLTVEVSTVLHGDLQPGMILTFANGGCGQIRPGDPDSVFLHVDDQRLLYPRSPTEELYTTVSREALDWYQSLTADQIRDLEARYLAGRPRWKELGATPGE